LVKEADAFAEAGYDVTVLYCLVADWAQKLDKDLLANVKWRHIQIGGTNKFEWKYQISRIRFAFYRFINEKISVKFFSEKAHARCYCLLLKTAIKLKADWYIGHNPGAMAIAANAAFYNKVKCGFDFEDYHRGEYLNLNNIILKRQIFIEKKYIPKFNYISTASSMIGIEVKKSFPYATTVTILNCFPKSLQSNFNEGKKAGLSMFWFSQHIGKDRGLEIVIEAIRELNMGDINLSLIGNCSQDVKNHLLHKAGNLATNIHFDGVINSDAIPSYASNFDVGLALELQQPMNRDICLTNKIFTYLLAGNAIIFSETAMQKNFNDEFHTGLSFPINDKQILKQRILFYKDNEILLKQRKYNYELAKEHLNWENESKKLLEIIH
jgi:glycosyltransferase involved in cell wall biosynthesis